MLQKLKNTGKFYCITGQIDTIEWDFQDFIVLDELSHFEWILNEIQEMPIESCKTFLDFVSILKTTSQKLNFFLKDDYKYLNGFSRLNELTMSNRFTIVMATRIYWKSNQFQPILIHIQQETKKQEMKRILETSENWLNIPDIPVDLLKQTLLDFASFFYDVTKDAIFDSKERKRVTFVLFIKFLLPVLDNMEAFLKGTLTFRKLIEIFQPFLKSDLNKLYLNQINELEYLGEKTKYLKLKQGSIQKSDTSNSCPYSTHTKYLLIASFLASYNQPKYDARMFNKGEKRKKLKRGGGNKKGLNTIDHNVNMQFLGPKMFTIDRMIAIFRHIVEEPVGTSKEIYAQLVPLIQRKQLLRIGSNNKNRDGNTKLKCCIGRTEILSICKTIGFELDKYLYDR